MSYSTLSIGDFKIESWHEEIDPQVMSLFRPSEKRFEPISQEEWEDHDLYVEDWSPEESGVEYSCLVHEMRDRLELQGYTLQTAERVFQIGVRRQALKASASEGGPSPTVALYDAPLLSTVTGLEWAYAVAGMISAQTDLELTRDTGLTRLETYVRARSHFQFGFPSYNTRCMLRLLVEAFPAQETVTFDLTDLVFDREFESASDAAGYADHLASQDYDLSRFTVVLTEGSSDRWIIARSLKVLYPHLSDFFSFMDFDGANMPGGAGHLANIVKAFAGAKIANRVIALFDNDTAGHSALQSLNSLKLPENMRALPLPDIAIASRYPTLGPSGLSEMNINGWACGIELYLGAECLADRDAQLAPIQWKGYDPRMRRYQGELLAKNEVLDRFERKLVSCESDAKRLDDFEWQDLRSVIDMLRTAFHDLDVAEIIEFESEHG